MSKRADIYKSVVEHLRRHPSTLLQVSKATNVNWETVKYAVETLKRINLLTSYEQNGRTYYTMNEAKFLELQPDTLLGLPISEEQRKTTLSLARRIKEKWEKIFPKRSLNKTFLQKILVKTVVKSGIKDVPYGWYLFGQCTLLYSIETNTVPANTKYDKEIEKVIKEYKNVLTTKDLIQKHYLEEGNELYLSRFKVSETLSYGFTKESLDLFKRNLKQFVFSFPRKDENDKIIELINAFYSLCIRLINSYNEKEMEDLRNMINDAFTSLWELMAAYNLYSSLQGKGWTEDAVLKRYYLLRTEIMIPIVEEYLTILQDHVKS